MEDVYDKDTLNAFPVGSTATALSIGEKLVVICHYVLETRKQHRVLVKWSHSGILTTYDAGSFRAHFIPPRRMEF